MPLGSKEHFAPPSGTVEKNPPASAGGARDIALIPGSRRSPEGGSGNPLQYSYLGMDRGAWWTAVHGVSQSRTQLGTQARTHRHTLRRHEEPPSLMPNLVVTISSFQEKHNLGKWRGFFSPAVSAFHSLGSAALRSLLCLELGCHPSWMYLDVE